MDLEDCIRAENDGIKIRGLGNAERRGHEQKVVSVGTVKDMICEVMIAIGSVELGGEMNDGYPNKKNINADRKQFS
jgi:hypothetical protein